MWRTERTYRDWAKRFADYLLPRSPYAATGEDVAGFLSVLAVRQRASPATQKQALNALVFLMQEALRRSIGELEFKRARAQRRVPTVLTPGECRRLFAQMTGSSRLMAELMYGAGLRLMELLRLRMHHLDFERRQLRVCGGKGDKDRVAVLPDSLAPRLRENIDRLRPLFRQDREAGLAGVWLPEGLARKYQRAGETWEWQWLFPSREVAVDPTTGTKRRHHVLEGTFQNAVRAGARGAKLEKRVTPHVLRHCVHGGTPLHSVPGPALDASRGLTISALMRYVVCDTSARERRGYSHRPKVAWTRERRDDSDLHACDAEAGAGGANSLGRDRDMSEGTSQGRGARFKATGLASRTVEGQISRSIAGRDSFAPSLPAMEFSRRFSDDEQ